MKRRNLLGAFAAAGAHGREPPASARIAAAPRKCSGSKDKPPGADVFQGRRLEAPHH